MLSISMLTCVFLMAFQCFLITRSHSRWIWCCLSWSGHDLYTSFTFWLILQVNFCCLFMIFIHFHSFLLMSIGFLIIFNGFWLPSKLLSHTAEPGCWARMLQAAGCSLLLQAAEQAAAGCRLWLQAAAAPAAILGTIPLRGEGGREFTQLLD